MRPHPEPVRLRRRSARRSLPALAAVVAAACAGAALPASARESGWLAGEDVEPRRVSFADGETVRYRFRTAGRTTRDLEVDVVRSENGRIVRRLAVRGVEPKTTTARRWDGIKRNGEPAPEGAYRIWLRDLDSGEWADHAEADGPRGFRVLSAAEAGGGEPTLGGGTVGEPTPSSGGGGEATVAREKASPGRVFQYAERRLRTSANYAFVLDGDRPHDVVLRVIRAADGKAFRRWRVDGAAPGEVVRRRWNGTRRRSRDPAPNGRYRFDLREAEGSAIEREESRGRHRFYAFRHKFPVRGAHRYGDGLGAGRGHRGVDIFQRDWGCGAPVVAARGGTVQYSGYQAGGAGRYAVIDAKRTRRDYVYMHLKRLVVREGQRVRTGEPIGRVGQSGNASGCHLHFEVWSRPGWYEGGRPIDAERLARRWDRWS